MMRYKVYCFEQKAITAMNRECGSLSTIISADRILNFLHWTGVYLRFGSLGRAETTNFRFVIARQLGRHHT
jgi:hypothetical protein